MHKSGLRQIYLRLQSPLKTKQLPTVTQELQICLLSQLDPLQGLLALLLQLESVGATHYPALLELLLDLEPVQLDLVGLEELELVELVLVDLELYLVDLDLELVELLVLMVELELMQV